MGLGNFPQATPYAKSCSVGKAAGLSWSHCYDHGTEVIISEHKHTVSHAFESKFVS